MKIFCRLFDDHSNSFAEADRLTNLIYPVIPTVRSSTSSTARACGHPFIFGVCSAVCRAAAANSSSMGSIIAEWNAWDVCRTSAGNVLGAQFSSKRFDGLQSDPETTHRDGLLMAAMDMPSGNHCSNSCDTHSDRKHGPGGRPASAGHALITREGIFQSKCFCENCGNVFTDAVANHYCRFYADTHQAILPGHIRRQKWRAGPARCH